MKILHKNIKLSMFLMALLLTTSSYSQQRTVAGTVTDAETNEPLPGVTIAVSETSRGTITDFNGQYSLEVQEGETLMYSFIGYLSQEITVGRGNLVNIQLVSSVVDIDEVVVIGYGQVRREDATGSVRAIGREDFN